MTAVIGQSVKRAKALVDQMHRIPRAGRGNSARGSEKAGKIRAFASVRRCGGSLNALFTLAEKEFTRPVRWRVGPMRRARSK
jgi:hypothetical protein